MTITLNLANVIVWLIVGLLAGSAAATVLSRRRRGFGYVANTLIGMVGALIGGFLFEALRINIPALRAIQIDLQQIFAAFIGALIFAALVLLVRAR
jgi:uncharacterized membrane protein YeaQ/YmgE (transglycosylase-associated protein family)